MKEILQDELKQIQLEMLKDIVSFCNANNITYFLAFGSLLGAVRHKGYIPWDDDIDICMPRPDYERFVFSYKNEIQNYQVVEFRKNSGYGLPFAKVSNENTTMDEFLYTKENFGVYVDVFPIDGFGSKKQITESKWLNKFLNTKKAVLGKKRSISKNIILIAGKALLLPFSVHSILNRMHKIATKFDFANSENTEIFCASIVERLVVPRSVFEKATILSFENIAVNVPVKYHEYLTFLYGNYMQPPPKEKQVTHHAFKAWWNE